MPRKKTPLVPNLPYHIFARSNNRDWFYLPIEQMWEICIDQLFNVTIAYGLRVHAFTLMNNHFHLLASIPFSNLGENMNYFMRETSRKVNQNTRRTNHVFGNRYKACLITDVIHYFNTYRYVYQNPLRVGICGKVEEYPFNTVRILFGQHTQALPIYPSVYDFQDPLMKNHTKTLGWLNRRVDKRSIKAISFGLTKTTFTLPVDRKTRKRFEFSSEEIDEIDAVLNHK